jgi:hypothetical protein
MWTVCEKGPSMCSAVQEEKDGPEWRLLLARGGRGPWMWKWEMRALDADYLEVGEEGPGCGLFASWRRGP